MLAPPPEDVTVELFEQAQNKDMTTAAARPHKASACLFIL
jgi:hypothetical protein